MTYKGNLIIPLADFLTETIQARREWNDTFKILKEKKKNSTKWIFCPYLAISLYLRKALVEVIYKSFGPFPLVFISVFMLLGEIKSNYFS